VFNLEVDVEHVYYVSTAGVLVHNTYPGNAPTSVEAVSQVNPRLLQRLEAFRAYKSNGGTMDMARWVSHTKANPNWGTGPKSGYADWIRSVESLHGNSKLSSRPAFLYRLEDADGNLLKWGVTQDLDTRYPQTFLLDKRLIEIGSGNRADILRWERDLLETLPGPLNFEPWAGRRAP
jgi:hypothetical protein